MKILSKISDKIEIYKKEPWRIRSEINAWLHKLKYYFFMMTDPPPRQKRGELTADYFERIEPKHGLRFYEALVNKSTRTDLGYALPIVEKMNISKKWKKDFREFLIQVYGIEQSNLENYKKYLIRNEILKKT